MSKTTFFRHLNTEAQKVVRCPHCTEQISLKQFHDEHAFARHRLDPKNCCVFCSGRHSWRRGSKHDPLNWKHLNACLKEFANVYRLPDPIEPPTPPIAEPNVTCRRDCTTLRGRNLAGRAKERLSEYVGFYESHFEKPEMWSGGGVEFDERIGLGGDACAIVRKFLQSDANWYHLMVKHAAFETFVRKMEKIRDRFVLLPFWCLCDGLKNKDGGRVTHRHAIAACDPDGSFERVWKDEVRMTDGKAKLCVRISDALQLVRTIAYVSRPKASCDVGIPDVEDEGSACSHFYMNRPLCKHAVTYMCTLIPDGVEKLLFQLNRNKKVIDWASDAYLVRDSNWNRRWAVPVRVTGFDVNLVVFVKKEYEPCEEQEETDFRLYFAADRSTSFEENPALLRMTDDEWTDRQASRGNSFRSIRNAPYRLSRSQQKTMNQIKKMERTTETRRDRFWREKMAETETRYKNNLERVEGKLIAAETERDALKEKVIELEKRLLESEIESLRSELSAIKARLAVVERENVELKKEIAALRLEEIERLRKDNERLQNENAQLLRRLDVFSQHENVKDPTSDSARLADGD